MDEQTRNLVVLFAEEEVELLVRSLSKDPQRVKDLARKSGLSESSTERRLHDLERWGVVRRSRAPISGRGRPATLWALASSAWTRFEQIADAFTLEQLEAEAERMRGMIDKRSRESVGFVKNTDGGL
jgi:predicted ArsR family transcriptional regulator